ncbi:ABC transporter substrate-binding protein [Luteimonas sp. BDR2-5]|uniref:ABC transporter substrate-binding protein n=1 Tax=Proluteimonas luteida TaxID=2878685 RepID=UPI001E44C232|nr:ABC transporter substrate-binding protein [Luteimonas sp. BDR2-5]MCD9029746.1 ABC transporter substrate-binding protein [Luteimonas sp. BDR2-5]
MRTWLQPCLAAASTFFLAIALAGCDAARKIPGSGDTRRITVYGTLEEHRAARLLASFEQRHPGIRVDYQRRDSALTYQQFISDESLGLPAADVVWNSSMSAQIKLINDGHSRPHRTRERRALPSWSVWKDEGYAITSEAMIYAFNSNLVASGDYPVTHEALARFINENSATLQGKIGILDLETNEIAFMGYSQDLIASRSAEGLYLAIAKTSPKVFETNRQLYEAVKQGDVSIAYNMLASYPLGEDAPHVRPVMPTDYTLMISRVAFIPERAPNPEQAAEFLDFLLSREAQTIIADERLGAVRLDVEDPTFRGRQFRPIRLGPSLLADFDQMRRERLLGQWKASLHAATSDLNRPRPRPDSREE